MRLSFSYYSFGNLPLKGDFFLPYIIPVFYCNRKRRKSKPNNGGKLQNGDKLFIENTYVVNCPTGVNRLRRESPIGVNCVAVQRVIAKFYHNASRWLAIHENFVFNLRRLTAIHDCPRQSIHENVSRFQSVNFRYAQ